ncbi:endoplasmic reticulum junction formation protein lunapark-A [Wyeomyia smithii]|uniref:endoplasmic reticulum junction formation protein lunapark-A n=1 Tax=Wyeomyia smithii TaxID=174621 RepID=UPI002468060F|nr:endoplasmic reticulum junction formation protein lunapark-A [Wyeomyia smithii]XP_055544081.1 endoplasmic reticulum junction formation protein lunapark-A [Wyeomyia smithii]
MGAIISRFRKEKTTYEVLENLEEKIKDIEAYTISTQARQKRFVGNFLVISIGLYVIAFIVFYFAFFPPTWKERIIHSLPLLICPMIITLIKKSLAWFFERKVIINTNELKELRAEKKKILEKVMDKETYKVAVDILNKFGDRSHKAQTQSLSALSPPKVIQQQPMTPKAPSTIARAPGLMPQSAPRPQMTPIGARQMPVTPIGFNIRPATPMSIPQQASFIQRPVAMGQQTMAYRRTPYPIINQNEKGMIEKMVDYLVGDGPNSRFAMICRECLMHNGMALQEEYEYAAFRCAFCGAFNAAKKQRPAAPRLPFEQAQIDKLAEQQRRSSESVSESEPSTAEDGNSVEAAATAPEPAEDETESPSSEEVFETENPPESQTLLASSQEPEQEATEVSSNAETLTSSEAPTPIAAETVVNAD